MNFLPAFARVGDIGVHVGRGGSKFVEAFGPAVAQAPAMTERERIAFDLFGASFFMPREDARLLVLVSAVEVLLDPQPRSAAAREHVAMLVRLTQASEALSRAEKDSILGTVRLAGKESINQAGQRLASERLGGRKYMGLDAKAFFKLCYSIRCRIAHGEVPQPTRAEIGPAVAQLEEFVGDLLSGPVLDLISLS